MYPLIGDHAGGGTLRPSTPAAICETARENCELLTQPLHPRYSTTPSAVAPQGRRAHHDADAVIRFRNRKPLYLFVKSPERPAYTCADETRLLECARDAAILIDEVQSARAAFRSTIVK
jgi:hypothetical protein